jgi:hypothetical protein
LNGKLVVVNYFNGTGEPEFQQRIARMKKRIVVEKEKVDAALSRLIHAKPVPRTSIKATSKRSPKPILSR